ncbi:hypothetical protein HHI36_022940, partial [Cryptolaemus montrouzieri]
RKIRETTGGTRRRRDERRKNFLERMEEMGISKENEDDDTGSKHIKKWMENIKT